MVVFGALVLFAGLLTWVGALRQVRLVRPAPQQASRRRGRWALQGPRLPGWLGGTVLGLGALGFAVAGVDARAWPYGLVALGFAIAASARLTVWVRSRPTR